MGARGMGAKPIALLVLALSFGAMPGAYAQDEKAGEGPTNKQNRFALYLEALTGSVDAEDLNSSIATSSTDLSRSFLDVDDATLGRAAIGWKLPGKKGRVLLRFEGYKEDHYSFRSEGLLSLTFDETRGLFNDRTSQPLSWWTYAAQPGGFTSERTTPLWNPVADDADADNIADLDEVRYAATPDLVLQGPAPRNLQNRVEVFDLALERDFGGRRYHARWMGGIRRYRYEGHVPAGAWLQVNSQGAGFTSGSILRPLVLRQDTDGAGTSMGLELQERFLRERLVLYQEARAAFVLLSADTDTGDIIILTNNGSEIVPVQARLQAEVDKSAWHTALEIGVRVRLVEGLHLQLAFLTGAFQDSVLLPEAIVLPETTLQARLTTVSGIFKTHDIRLDGWLGGVTFQF